MENKLKHLEFIQNNIARMNNNCIHLKTWAVLIAVGALSLSSSQDNWIVFVVSILPISIFCILDIQLSKIERKYRELYDSVRKLDEKDIDFTMDVSGITIKNKSNRTIVVFYAGIIIALFILSYILFYPTQHSRCKLSNSHEMYCNFITKQ